MAYRCLECGHIFDEGEQAVWEEHHPYGMGYAAESFSGCPICNGSFEKTKKCKICEGEFLEEELNGYVVCNDCIDDYQKNFEICYKISKKMPREEIKINSLIATVLSVEEIENLLEDYISQKHPDIDCEKFINIDRDWFAETLIEEVNKNEHR